MPSGLSRKRQVNFGAEKSQSGKRAAGPEASKLDLGQDS